MNGIKMSDCDFYVDEEKRTVVCVYPKSKGTGVWPWNGASDLVIDFIEENFDFPDISLCDGVLYSSLKNKLKMPYRFVGKAVCAPEDEWNEELGKKIAFARAKEKCYDSFFKRANLFVHTVTKRLGDAIDIFNNFGDKISASREALEDSINQALAPKEE